MRKRFSLLLAFLAALALTSPAYAGPAEEAKAADTKAADTTAADTKAEEPEAKAEEPEAKAEEPETKEPEAEEAETEEGPAEIKDDDEAIAAVKQLIEAAKNGHWALVVALGIMLLVYVLHRFGLAAKLGKKVVPWVAAATGVLGYVAAALLVEGATIPNALTGGRNTAAEQKEEGGDISKCVVYEMYAYHFMPDDKELTEIYRKCTSGEMLCGECCLDILQGQQ